MCRRFTCGVALVLVLALTSGAWAELVGHWKFDEGTGTTARDASGNGNDGTLTAGPVWTKGMLGGALQFNGSSYVDCGNAANLAFTKPFSIACWVNPADLSGDRAFVARAAAGVGYAFKSNSTHLRFTTPGVLDHDGNNSILQLNTWQHVAVTFTPGQAGGCVFYINGVQTDALTASALTAGAGPFEIGHNFWGQWCMGMMDDVQVYDHVLTAAEVAKAMEGIGPGLAVDPIPESETTDVPIDSRLAWTPGEFAATHDVYLGTSFDDVNNASRTDPRSVLVSRDQADAAFDADGLLEFGKTYYWRIDEVNAAPDYTIFKGEVWSFTVEPFAYPVTAVTATASAFQAGMGPENTINGSGLVDDRHGVNLPTMWMTTGVLPAWIQYEFDKVYKLDEMLVWNSNQAIETFLGFGAKSVTIEYSADGETWTALEGATEFAKASGAATYTANTTVDFAGAMAKFVKITIHSNWGGVAPQTGLSEVRFLAIPVQAFKPSPAVGATGVSVEAELSWRPGREATSHTVYVGADSDAVAAGTVAGVTVSDHSYSPASLSYATTYYWKVDETGDAGTYAGEVWSFTTEAFSTVEDFESYNDDDNRIYDVWVDGLTDNASGSQVGYDQSPFAEQTIVHGGKQSMPLIYGNTKFAFSEAKRTFGSAQDWTARGVKTLSLFFHGAAGNTGKLYVKINSTKVAYDGPATDIAAGQWLPWNVDLSAVSGNLAKVTSLTIGIEGSGAAGTLYVDDIRLSPKTPEYIVPVQPGNTGLVAKYTFTGDYRDSVGSHHGTASGNTAIVSDPVHGQVATFDGTTDKVDIAYSADLNPTTFTAGFWAKPNSAGSSHRSPVTSRDDSPQRGYIFYIEPGNAWQFWTGTGSGWDAVTGPVATMDEWAHVAGTYADGIKSLYINGRLASQSATATALGQNTQRPLRLGGGATEGDGNYWWYGLLDDVCVYNRALSPEEVAGLAGLTTSLPKAL
jgi:hypothetical protein